MSQIPPELYDRIISELKYNTDDLKQLALTSPNLTPICQRHLLRTITLGKIPAGRDPEAWTLDLWSDITPGSPTHFLSLLDESPHIKNYVQTLVVNNSRKPQRMLPYNFGPAADCWLAQDIHLQAILPLLRNLVTLKVSSDIPSQPSWQSLPVPFVKILVETLRLPSVTTVDLFHAPIFSLLRGAGNNVKHVVMHPSNHDIDIDFPVASQQTIFLESLVVKQDCNLPDIADRLKGNLPNNVLLSELKRLDIDMTAGRSGMQASHASAAEILCQCAQTLEVLTLSPCVGVFRSAHQLATIAQSNTFAIELAREMGEFRESIDVSTLRALRRLHLKDLLVMESSYPSVARFNCMPWLIELLRKGSRIHKQLVEIEFDVEYNYSEPGDLAPTRDRFLREWMEVINVLLNGAYPKLRVLKVNLSPPNTGLAEWFMSGVAESLLSQRIAVHVQ